MIFRFQKFHFENNLLTPTSRSILNLIMEKNFSDKNFHFSVFLSKNQEKSKPWRLSINSKMSTDPMPMHDQVIAIQILGENPPPDARLFFSVERFDYTKGIKEKLYGYRRYLEKYPNRTGKDVLLQVRFTLEISFFSSIFNVFNTFGTFEFI